MASPAYAIPLIVLGLILAMYWHRVLRMVRKTRQRTGHAANLLPPETTGRWLRLIWIPIIVIWIAHPFLVAMHHSLPRLLHPVWFSPILCWVACVTAAACFAATRVCWRRMGRAWRMGIDPAEQTPLVTSGPYAYIRHPIYVLSATMILATAAAIPTPLMLLTALMHVLLLIWEAHREDRHLARRCGVSYERYRQAVGAVAPRRRAMVSNAPARSVAKRE